MVKFNNPPPKYKKEDHHYRGLPSVSIGRDETGIGLSGESMVGAADSLVVVAGIVTSGPTLKRVVSVPGAVFAGGRDSSTKSTSGSATVGVTSSPGAISSCNDSSSTMGLHSPSKQRVRAQPQGHQGLLGWESPLQEG